MISVIIATKDSERPLLASLAALVPAAVEGVVGEVIVVDGGSRDDTATVADAAGCKFVTVEGPLGPRLKAGAAAARGPWLLFVRPGTLLDAPWAEAARRFAARSGHGERAAVFRSGAAQSTLREAILLLASLLRPWPRPEQGLLIAKPFYDSLGGHSDRAADAEADLLRRIGRRRIATLPPAVHRADT